MENFEQPVTKADLTAALEVFGQRFVEALDQRFEALDQRFEAQDQRFQGRLDVQEQRLRDHMAEAIQDAETRLLSAFYSFAEGDDKRHRTTESTVAGVVERLASVESRLLTVEKKLNMPPGA